MITARTAPLRDASAPAAVMAIPGDWPGPAMDGLPYLVQMVIDA